MVCADRSEEAGDGIVSALRSAPIRIHLLPIAPPTRYSDPPPSRAIDIAAAQMVVAAIPHLSRLPT